LTTAQAAGITAFVAQNTETATPAKYLEVTVDIEATALNPIIAYRKPSPSGYETLNLTKAREQYVGGPRAFAFLRDVDYAQHENTDYRVFLNCDYLSPET